MTSEAIKEYGFPSNPEELEYQLFPIELEGDRHVFFHGTARKNLEEIISKGFKTRENLQSISFADKSSLSLKYASEARSSESPEGDAIVVRFGDLNKPGIKRENFGIYLYDMELQPEIIGYCVVPDLYNFL